MLSDLIQAAPNHLADESQTRLEDTQADHPFHFLVSKKIRYRLVQVRHNLKTTFQVGGLQLPFSISSSFVLFFVSLPFFLEAKIQILRCIDEAHNGIQC